MTSGKYMHVRCIAHIFNLVVREGLNDVKTSVTKIRNVVKYVRSSPARLKKFKECVDSEESYFMVEAESDDQGGVLSFIDWHLIKRMAKMLHQFYLATLHISGSIYVTSNTYWTKISDLYVKLSDWKESDDVELRDMTMSMQSKFDKYWRDYDRMNKLIFMVSALDSREKFEYMEDALQQIYGDEKSKHLFDGVKIIMSELFEEYKKKLQPDPSSSLIIQPTSVSTCEGMEQRGLLKQRIKRKRIKSETVGDRKSKLDMYLNETAC
ncbi:zinc finger BED domain-containing protein RICESLEEPER 2-like [Canna indica]|uniref:Zinc finger BED domain-containing protein RICESLEEPER 2-like n=1 Tax=Canna indica TaxID=4628 RepID=A0AAQ3K148_9LILI|nr:zinc finger BED domain-containing protein RICESLEEPER 2-like [Canna indica]